MIGGVTERQLSKSGNGDTLFMLRTLVDGAGLLFIGEEEFELKSLSNSVSESFDDNEDCTLACDYIINFFIDGVLGDS